MPQLLLPLYQKLNVYVLTSLKNTKQTKIHTEAEALTLQHLADTPPAEPGWGPQPQVGEMGANSPCKAQPRLIPGLVPSVLSSQAEAEPLSQGCKLAPLCGHSSQPSHRDPQLLGA